MFSAQLYEEQCDKVESLTQDYEDRIVDLSEKLEHSESLIQAAQQECEQRDEQIQSLNHTVQQVDQSMIIFGMLVVAAHSDRKSTRLNSSHQIISYAVFCLKKKN